jgi:hypothetical protein
MKSLKGVGIALSLILLAVLVPVIVLHGMVWFSTKALPLLDSASLAALVFCVVVLPLSLFRRTRRWAGNVFYTLSYLFGTMLFAFACVVAYQNWGYGGLIIGLIFAGIGVVPVACLAALLHGQWSVLGQLAFVIVTTFGIRSFGLYLLSKASSEEELRDAMEDSQEPIDV